MKQYAVTCFNGGIAESKEFKTKAAAKAWAAKQSQSPLFAGGEITLISVERLY